MFLMTPQHSVSSLISVDICQLFVALFLFISSAAKKRNMDACVLR